MHYPIETACSAEEALKVLVPGDSATMWTSVNPKLALLRARVGDPRDGY